MKTRNFGIVDLPDLGLRDVLVVPSDEKNQMEHSPKFLKMIHSGEIFSVVKGIHIGELQHSGYKKVVDHALRHYFGITRGVIQ